MSREKCHASSLYDCLECKFLECIRSPSSKIPGESPGAMRWLNLTDYAEKWLCDEYSEDYDRGRKKKREKKERNEKIVKTGEETRRARPEKER